MQEGITKKTMNKSTIEPVSPQYLIDGADNAPVTVILAHGAGAPMDSPFMDAFAKGLSEGSMRVVRFEFPYMAERRKTGKKMPPNRMPILMETWGRVIDDFSSATLVIGGKSMGGRVASMIAIEKDVAGLVCLGYPFHPPGKPEKTRLEHYADLKTPTLILQGTRDTLGNFEDVAGYDLPDCVSVHWLEDGDHGFKPRKKSGRSEEQNWQEAIDAFVAFAQNCQ